MGSRHLLGVSKATAGNPGAKVPVSSLGAPLGVMPLGGGGTHGRGSCMCTSTGVHVHPLFHGPLA